MAIGLGTAIAVGLGSLVGGLGLGAAAHSVSSKKSTPTTNISTPVGSTYRGLGSSIFNAENIAMEDWLRQQQAAQLAFDRESAFNAAEAEKNRAFQKRMANTQYQRAVADLKRAGLNPVLAYENPAAAPSGGSASASSAGGASAPGSNDALLGLLQLFSGLYQTGANNATMKAIAKQRYSQPQQIQKIYLGKK